MRNKKKAIQKIKEVGNGSGIDRNNSTLLSIRGRIAKKLWNDAGFTLGMEYGYILALIEFFKIKKKDLT